MRHLIILCIFFFSLESFSQTKPDGIVGKWLKTPKEDLVIQVFKQGDVYKGKIIRDKKDHPKKIVGFTILENLKYNPDKNNWIDGKIHDPNTGKTYDANAKINSDGSLEVLCYIGMKFLGTKKYFKRIK